MFINWKKKFLESEKHGVLMRAELARSLRDNIRLQKEKKELETVCNVLREQCHYLERCIQSEKWRETCEGLH